MADRSWRCALPGGALAAAAAVLGHYVYLFVDEACITAAGFVAGYAWCRARQGRSEGAREDARRFAAADRPPRWIAVGRRVAVVAGVLALLFGDRVLYELGLSGLLRKIGAVAIATATVTLGFWSTRWPRD